MKQARITKSFRIADQAGGTRKYRPGEVAEGRAAEVAIEGGYGVVISAKASPKTKVKTVPKNKAK